jgi:hypothetical protein
LRYFDRAQRGEVLSRVTNDIDNPATAKTLRARFSASLLPSGERSSPAPETASLIDDRGGRERSPASNRMNRSTADDRGASSAR